MWDVMERDVSYSTKPGGDLQSIEKVDVKVRNVIDSEIDILATLIDGINHRFMNEKIIHIEKGHKDYVLTMRYVN